MLNLNARTVSIFMKLIILIPFDTSKVLEMLQVSPGVQVLLFCCLHKGLDFTKISAEIQCKNHMYQLKIMFFHNFGHLVDVNSLAGVAGVQVMIT